MAVDLQHGIRRHSPGPQAGDGITESVDIQDPRQVIRPVIAQCEASGLPAIARPTLARQPGRLFQLDRCPKGIRNKIDCSIIWPKQ